MPRMLVLLLAAACATAPERPAEPFPERPPAIAAPAPPPSEEILSSGGDAALSIPPPASIELVGDEVIAWSMTEVPGDSRLQAALAMVDALARAELQKSIAVGVASLEIDVQRADADEVARMSAEVAKGLLPGLDPPRHAWQKVRREGAIILRLVARLRAQRAEVERAIATSLAGEDDRAALARRIVERMAGSAP